MADETRALDEIQRVLDPRRVLAIRINPESGSPLSGARRRRDWSSRDGVHISSRCGMKRELQACSAWKVLKPGPSTGREQSWPWFRILGSAHTNPIFVRVGEQPIRASKKRRRVVPESCGPVLVAKIAPHSTIGAARRTARL